MTTTKARSARARSRKIAGNVALITALAIVMLCAFAALAVDVGNIYRVRSQERAALDAAALAAAGALNGTAAGIATARQRAKDTARQHRVNKTSLELTDAEIAFGTWTTTFQQPEGLLPGETHAVRISHVSEPINHPFAAVLGGRASPVAALATALGGGPPQLQCPFPLAVADCNVDSTQQWCNVCGVMRDNGADTMGWTSMAGSANPNTIGDAVLASCMTGSGRDAVPAVNADGSCAQRCNDTLTAGRSEIPLNNGNNFSNGANSYCDYIKRIIMRNGTPEPFTVTVPVIDGGGQPCNPSFNRTKPVTGFAEVRIFGIKCGTADRDNAVVNPAPATCPTNLPSDKWMLFQMECKARVNAPTGGGPFYGVTGRPRLVE